MTIKDTGRGMGAT